MKVRVIALALSASAALLVSTAHDEGYRSKAYPDAGGVWTVGFGETQGVTRNTTTTPERALIQLGKSLDKHEQGLKKCIGNVPLYQHEYDAYLNLAYNVGAGAVCGSSIPKKLKTGQYEEACKTILSFDKIRKNGKPVSCKDPKNNCQGVVARWELTYRMCMKGEYQPS